MKPVILLLTITDHRFSIVRYPAEVALPAVSVEQQAMDPRLGLVADSSALSTLAKALNAAIREATGCTMDALAVKGE